MFLHPRTKATLLAIFGKFFEQVPNFSAPVDGIEEDNETYFVSVKRSVGWFGWRYSSEHVPVRLNRGSNAYFMDEDIQYLTDKRRDTESRYYIGKRDYLLENLSFLTHADFDDTPTVEFLRSKDANSFIDELTNQIPHPAHVFTTWLRAQIEAGLTELNGIVLRDHSVTLGTGVFATRKVEHYKECEPEGYLALYQSVLKRQYDAMPLAEAEMKGGYVLPSIDELARQLLKEQASSYLGLGLVMMQNTARNLALNLYNRKLDIPSGTGKTVTAKHRHSNVIPEAVFNPSTEDAIRISEAITKQVNGPGGKLTALQG